MQEKEAHPSVSSAKTSPTGASSCERMSAPAHMVPRRAAALKAYEALAAFYADPEHMEAYRRWSA
jgi:hypothetical protein